jgi:predicted nucleotidyltransferase
MKNQIMKALEEFVNTADALLNNRILAAYCFGSAVYDDFHEGYSDLDFFLIVDSLLSEEDFDQFHLLREQYKHSTNPYLSVLEGEIVPISAIRKSNTENVIYWGTSKDRFNQKYGLTGFSLRGLLEKGCLIFGTDIRKEIPYPSDETMLEWNNKGNEDKITWNTLI